MDDILKSFSKGDSRNDFEHTLKAWDDNIGLNIHNDFNYLLEEDDSFENNNKNDNGDFLFCTMFNCKTIINKNLINSYDFASKGIQKKSMIKINRISDCVAKPFLRLKLKNNVNSEEIINILTLLCDASFDYIQGGVTIINIPKLLFNFIICKKYDNDIKIIDVEQLLSEMTMDELIDKAVVKGINSVNQNQKYMFEDETSKYLDIPLLLDFYSYNSKILLIATQFHDIFYELNIPGQNIKELSKYVDNIYLLHEQNIFASNIERKNIATCNANYLMMKSKNNYYHGFCDTTVTAYGYQTSKFAFVIMRKHYDDENDSTQYPQIVNVNVVCEDNTNIFIEPQNIWVEQFNEILIYGIALDGVSDMNNWIKVMNECSSVKTSDFISIQGNYNNLNPNNFEGVFQHINLKEITIDFNCTTTPVNMEILFLNQNIQMIAGGMTGCHIND